jgi:acyl-CoA synthetase (AMP-forming)/AMP-acid ligase II
VPARCVGDWLEHWARQTPERIFLGDRANADMPWRTVTYADALRQVRSAAAWILAQRLSAERPLVILADNSVDHALFALAAQHVGVPSAAISQAYSLMSKDFDKLKGMIKLLGQASLFPVQKRLQRRAACATFGPYRQQRRRDTETISVPLDAATPETPDVAKPLRLRPGTSQKSCSPRVQPVRRGRHQHPAHVPTQTSRPGAGLGLLMASGLVLSAGCPGVHVRRQHISIWCCAAHALYRQP